MRGFLDTAGFVVQNGKITWAGVGIILAGIVVLIMVAITGHRRRKCRHTGVRVAAWMER